MKSSYNHSQREQAIQSSFIWDCKSGLMKSVLVYSQLLPCVHLATMDRPDNRDSG